MSRTNIDIDDELVAEAMRRYNLKTKREAVDLALRRLVGPKITTEDILSLRGIGWVGDLDEMRNDDPEGRWRSGSSTVRSGSTFFLERDTPARQAVEQLAQRPTEIAITQPILLEALAGASPVALRRIERGPSRRTCGCGLASSRRRWSVR
jgi:Arc/MetJ family transcription regulator